MEEIIFDLCCFIFFTIAFVIAISKGWYKEALRILFG
tara:strand:+ start:516 stop:626 length:111 start_codon:yes stop_codon:yes gene_type:complete